MTREVIATWIVYVAGGVVFIAVVIAMVNQARLWWIRRQVQRDEAVKRVAAGESWPPIPRQIPPPPPPPADRRVR